jgi:hypothetical protein
LLTVLVLGAGLDPAAAQTVQFYDSSGDSVLAILTGDTATIRLRVTSATGGISAYRVTLFLDDSRVTLAAADSFGYTQLDVPTITAGSGQVTIEASGAGYNSTTVDLANLVFAMAAGAQEGSLISMRVDSLASTTSADLLPSHRTDVLDVCQAVQRWGDLDDSRTITSRDALIAVTHAVGLPIGAFDESVGDVDEDGITSTRDALAVLSYVVGAYYYGTRTGENRANRCAPLEPMPGDAAFRRNTILYQVPAGDTVAAPVGVTMNYTYPMSWAPDGSRILYTDYFDSRYHFIGVTPDGSVRDTVSPTGTYDLSPSWSPDGTQIAFISVRSGGVYNYYSVFVMDVDGANEVRLTDSIYVDYNSRLGWSPDGSQIAFRGYNANACCSNKLWKINADGTGLAEVYPVSSSQQPLDPVWSPAGDSLAYDYGSVGMIYKVAATGDTNGVRTSRLTNGQDYPNWMPEGILFRGYPVPQYGVFLFTNSGRHLQITDGTSSDHDLTIRRTTRYVESVTLAPASATIGPAGTQEYVVTVLDDVGGGIVPGSGVRCTSSDEAVATVVTNASQNCLVTGVAGGTATITATTGGWRSGTASVTVVLP